MTLSRRLRARFGAVAAFAATLGVAGGFPPATSLPPLPRLQPNDNRVSAGRLEGDTLHNSLVVQKASWHPEAEDGRAVEVEAFAEEGKIRRFPVP